MVRTFVQDAFSDASLVRSFWQVPMGGGLRADTGPFGETMSLGWLGGNPPEELEEVAGEIHLYQISGRKWMDRSAWEVVIPFKNHLMSKLQCHSICHLRCNTFFFATEGKKYVSV